MAGQGTGMVLAPCHENPPASVVSLGFRSSPPGYGSNAYSSLENIGMNPSHETLYNYVSPGGFWLKLTTGPWLSLH